MLEDYKKLNERFLESRNYKDRWLALYKNLYAYVIPNRDAFNVKFNYRDDGKPVTLQVWDDTAVLSSYQRANDLHGLLMPKDRIWGKLALDPHLYDKDLIKKSEVLIDEMNDRIFFYLNKSNLTRVVSSSNLDLVGGTAAMWVESISDEEPLYFRSIAAVALYIEYSTDDVIETCWFANKLSGRYILENFNDYHGTCFDTLESCSNETFTVNFGQIKYSNNKFLIYAVLDDDPLHPLFERESDYQQIIIYRDRVRPGEAEGRGVGIDLLNTIQDLNRIVEYSRKSLAFKALPPMFYDTGTYFNPYAVRQWAGTLIARNPQGRNPIEPMQMPESPQVMQDIMRLQEIIQKGFQVDPLGEIQSPAKSATEISIRENRAQRTSATDISRLINELPAQVFSVAAKILNSRNLLTKDRVNIPGFSPKKMRFDFQSPLFDIQNQQDLNAFTTSLQIKQQFFGEGAAMATINIFEANDFLNKKLNIPKKLSATDDEIKQFLQQLAQQQQPAQQQVPSPSTSASPVNLPQQQGITI